MTKWEVFFDNKIVEISKEFYILDIGGGFKLQKGLSKYEKLFEKSDYKVLDKNIQYKPDILGDVENMSSINDNSVDAIICKAVLEHVEDPISSCKEIYRILKPGGKCLVYTPFLYSYHAEKGVYGDYYRYTIDGLRFLFRNFSHFEYCPVRGRFETIFYLFPVKILRKFLSRLARVCDNFFKTDYQSSGYFVYLIK